MHIGIYILALQIISNPRIWIGAKELGNCCFRFCVFIDDFKENYCFFVEPTEISAFA